MEKEKILRTSTPKANRQHICAVCGKPIEKGEKYLNLAIKKGSKLVNRKTHLNCSVKKEPVSMCVPGSVLTEEQFKQHIREDALNMLETFTFNENMQIAFVPIIIAEVAWHYAISTIKKAAEYRIEETKKLSRSVKMLRDKYLAECSKDLDKSHLERMVRVSDKFIASCGNDFTLLWFSVNNELKRHWSDIAYQDMRTEAVISMVLLQMLKEHNKSMDELMSKKLDREVPSYKHPIEDALYDCMDAFVSPCSIKYEGNVRTSMQIISKKFNAIEWDIK